MSKDLNEDYKEAVENVDKIIDYCISTLIFWNFDKEWPMNLITESLKISHESMKFIKSMEFNND